MRTPLIAVTGRFQPFHTDHLELILRAVGESDRVIVGITNPDARSRIQDSQSPHRHRDDANPFSYFERQMMIARSLLAAGLAQAQFTIVPFPLEAPELWDGYIPRHAVQLVRTFTKWEDRKVELLRRGGYEVQAIPGDLQWRIAASDVRRAIVAGGDWREHLPQGTVEVLSEIGEQELRSRCTTDIAVE